MLGVCLLLQLSAYNCQSLGPGELMNLVLIKDMRLTFPFFFFFGGSSTHKWTEQYTSGLNLHSTNFCLRLLQCAGMSVWVGGIHGGKKC